MTQRALDTATALICQFEGFRAAPYRDQAGVTTIGYGTIRIDGEPVTMATPPCTEPQARAWMETELAAKVAALDGSIPTDATDNQRAAAFDLAYNIGAHAFLASTLLWRWEHDGAASAALHFADWVYVHDPVTQALVKSAGLVRRRAAEAALFLKADGE